MTAHQRIENLTHAWIGYGVVAGLATLLLNGLGVFSVIWALGSVAVSVVVALFFGRKLLARSSITRTFLLVVSVLGALFGGLADAKLGWALLHGLSFQLLVLTALALLHASMCVRSFRVLTDRVVKAHFA